jgi:hypothetical protein
MTFCANVSFRVHTCRSVQAGVYSNVFVAAKQITSAAGLRGLFTGYLPTLLEDIPDMAFKFAAYESMRSARLRLMRGRKATVQVASAIPMLCDRAEMLYRGFRCVDLIEVCTPWQPNHPPTCGAPIVNLVFAIVQVIISSVWFI